MKMRLLTIGLMSLLAGSMQASSVREIIAKNPEACAVVGYVAGVTGYNVYKSGISFFAPVLTDTTLVFHQGQSVVGFYDNQKLRENDSKSDQFEENCKYKFQGNFDSKDKMITMGYGSAYQGVYAHILGKPIAIGLVTSAAFYGLAMLAAKK